MEARNMASTTFQQYKHFKHHNKNDDLCMAYTVCIHEPQIAIDFKTITKYVISSAS